MSMLLTIMLLATIAGSSFATMEWVRVEMKGKQTKCDDVVCPEDYDCRRPAKYVSFPTATISTFVYLSLCLASPTRNSVSPPG